MTTTLLFASPRTIDEKEDGIDNRATAVDSDQDMERDRRVVESARRGDLAATRALYEAYAPQIARRLRRILGQEADVQDALQTTFEAVFRNLHRFDLGRPLTPWLNGFALRVAQNVLRSRRRRWWQRFGDDKALREEPTPEPSVDEHVDRCQAVRAVYAAMDRLSPKQRIAFALYEIEGLSFAEIGRLQKISSQAARERVQSARSHVLEELGSRGVLSTSLQPVSRESEGRSA